jgi:4-aminobutyrate aminotransferase-like enzyme
VNVSTAERRYLARDQESEGVEVVRTEGNYLIDAKRKRYVDFVMGWCVGNFGWGNRAAKQRRRRFNGPDYVFPGYSYRGWTELAELLAQITPGELTKSYRATGGSEAIDIALQAAMVHTKRRKFRLRGLAIGVDVGNEEYATKIQEKCRRAGLLLSTEETALVLLPALTIRRGDGP